MQHSSGSVSWELEKEQKKLPEEQEKEGEDQ